MLFTALHCLAGRGAAVRILIGKLFVICALVLLLLGPGAETHRESVITNIMSDDTKYLDYLGLGGLHWISR